MPQEPRQRTTIDPDAILFHGTTASFSAFSDEYLWSLGHHFGCLDQAKYRARQRQDSGGGIGLIISARLRAQNVVNLRGSDCGWESPQKIVICLIDYVFDAMEASELLNGGSLSLASYPDSAPQEERQALFPKIVASLEDKGYDGIVYSNIWEPPDETKREAWLVFRASQIDLIKCVRLAQFNEPSAAEPGDDQ